MTSERTEAIRRGNQLFQEGKIREAASVFVKHDYQDGLIRMGDYYLFEQNDLIAAVKFYKKAEYRKGIDSVAQKIVPVLRKWLSSSENPDIPPEEYARIKQAKAYADSLRSGDTPEDEDNQVDRLRQEVDSGLNNNGKDDST